MVLRIFFNSFFLKASGVLFIFSQSFVVQGFLLGFVKILVFLKHVLCFFSKSFSKKIWCFPRFFFSRHLNNWVGLGTLLEKRKFIKFLKKQEPRK